MKSGASDPFADDTPDEPERDQESQSEPTESAATDERVEHDSSTATGSVSDSTPGITKADLPLLLRRETVKGERENVHQLFVQDDTNSKARQAENELSERLNTDVYRLDAREAIYLAGMENLEDAEDILREWGYNF